MKIDSRFNVKCNNITTSSGFDLPWVNEIRYLGIYIVKSRSFKCRVAGAADRQELHCRSPTVSTPIRRRVIAVGYRPGA